MSIMEEDKGDGPASNGSCHLALLDVHTAGHALKCTCSMFIPRSDTEELAIYPYLLVGGALRKVLNVHQPSRSHGP